MIKIKDVNLVILSLEMLVQIPYNGEQQGKIRKNNGGKQL